jgi:hypothetical protein
MTVEEKEFEPYKMPHHWGQRAQPLHPSLFMSPTDVTTWWNAGNTKLILGELVIYFNYQHVLAFFTPLTGLRISENWTGGSSLGRMLNTINKDKNIRIKREQVVEELAKYLTEEFHF